jgi:hypothetical protein
MEVNEIKIEKFICGDTQSEAQEALADMLKDENIGTF